MKHFKEEIKIKAIKLRKGGMTYTKIAKTLNVGWNTAHKWTKGIYEIRHPLYKINKIKHDYFSEENMLQYPERMVIVGFIAADGCVYNSKYGQKRLCFNISKKDKEILDFINKELCNSSRKIGFNKKTKSCQLYFTSNKICQSLQRFKIRPRKTNKYRLPCLSLSEMSYFLKGYFFGDGCYYFDNKAKRKIYHFIGTTQFATDLRKFIIDNNIVKHVVVSKLKNKTYSQIVFQGKNATDLEKFIFANSKFNFLKRKTTQLLI